MFASRAAGDHGQEAPSWKCLTHKVENSVREGEAPLRAALAKSLVKALPSMTGSPASAWEACRLGLSSPC